MSYLLVDQGGVLLSKQKNHEFDCWLTSFGVKPSKMHRIYDKLSWNFQRGKLSGVKVMEEINRTLITNIPVKEFFRKKVGNPSINWQMIRFIKELKKKGIKVCLLSDISRPSWDCIRKRFGFFSIFNQKILSCNSGFRKEEVKYYSYLEKRLHCTRGELILIDDTAEIIRIAKEAGLQAVLYTKHKDFMEKKAGLVIKLLS